MTNSSTVIELNQSWCSLATHATRMRLSGIACRFLTHLSCSYSENVELCIWIDPIRPHLWCYFWTLRKPFLPDFRNASLYSLWGTLELSIFLVLESSSCNTFHKSLNYALNQLYLSHWLTESAIHCNPHQSNSWAASTMALWSSKVGACANDSTPSLPLLYLYQLDHTSITYKSLSFEG